MAWKDDTFSFFFLGIDVNATNENGIAAIEEYEENETADVRDPAR